MSPELHECHGLTRVEVLTKGSQQRGADPTQHNSSTEQA